jgi:hypothetical protein
VRVIDSRPVRFDRLEMMGGSAVAFKSADSTSMVCENAIQLSHDGVFHFDLRPISAPPHGESECRFRVYRGAANVQVATLPAALASGTTMLLNRRCGDMIPWHQFETAEVDDLYRWSTKR